MYDLLLLQKQNNGVIDWVQVQRRFNMGGGFGPLELHLLAVRENLGLAIPIEIKLTPVSSMRLWRRHVLRRFPRLRYVHPMYMPSVLLKRWVQVLRTLLTPPRTHKAFVRSHLHSDALDTYSLRPPRRAGR